MKNFQKISGVYKITNKINGKFYIGSSINIKRRWESHKEGIITLNAKNIISYYTKKCENTV